MARVMKPRPASAIMSASQLSFAAGIICSRSAAGASLGPGRWSPTMVTPSSVVKLIFGISALLRVRQSVHALGVFDKEFVDDVGADKVAEAAADVAFRRGRRQADVAPAPVEGRAAGSAAVDERRRLDEVGPHPAAHHAGRERERLRADAGITADIDRIAQVQAERSLLGLGQRDGRELLGKLLALEMFGDLQQREVGLVVHGHCRADVFDLRRIMKVGGDADAAIADERVVLAHEDVLIGDDEAALVDDGAGTRVIDLAVLVVDADQLDDRTDDLLYRERRPGRCGPGALVGDRLLRRDAAKRRLEGGEVRIALRLYLADAAVQLLLEP